MAGPKENPESNSKPRHLQREEPMDAVVEEMMQKPVLVVGSDFPLANQQEQKASLAGRMAQQLPNLLLLVVAACLTNPRALAAGQTQVQRHHPPQKFRSSQQQQTSSPLLW